MINIVDGLDLAHSLIRFCGKGGPNSTVLAKHLAFILFIEDFNNRKQRVYTSTISKEFHLSQLGWVKKGEYQGKFRELNITAKAAQFLRTNRTQTKQSLKMMPEITEYTDDSDQS
jgi:hypothetical protein